MQKLPKDEQMHASVDTRASVQAEKGTAHASSEMHTQVC